LTGILIGIDVGTLDIKAVAFDFQGKVLCSRREEYELLTPKPNWVEQDPNLWWYSIKNTVRGLFAKADIDSSDVEGIGLSVLTPALVPVDKNGVALRNAILMIDQRAVSEVEWIRRTVGEERVFEITGNRIAPGTYTAPSMLWIKRNEPRVYEKVYKFLHVNGYIVHKMTGVFVTDYTQASATLLFETGGRKIWSEDLCNQLGIPADKLPDVHPSWEVVGELTGEAARELGLRAGIPVVAGANDTACACIGTGVVEEGMVLESIGTTITLSYITRKPAFDKRVLNRLHAVPDRWILMGALSTPGAAYRWLRDQFYRRTESEVSYTLMDEEAEASPPGAKGLIFMPYLSGERTPIWNPNARGLLFGLTLRHTRRDVTRAFLEGGAYCVRDALEVFRSRDLKISEIRVTGGGSKSALWRQIMADVLGEPLTIPKTEEASALGAAILGGTGTKVYENPISAAKELVDVEEGEKPRLKLHRRYQRYYSLFKRLYENLINLYDDIANLEVAES